MSMSMMPANASPVENVCVKGPAGTSTCTKEIVDEQHAIMVFGKLNRNSFAAGCHYKISDLAESTWKFNFEHGLERCPPTFSILKALVTVRGS